MKMYIIFQIFWFNYINVSTYQEFTDIWRCRVCIFSTHQETTMSWDNTCSWLKPYPKCHIELTYWTPFCYSSCRNLLSSELYCKISNNYFWQGRSQKFIIEFLIQRKMYLNFRKIREHQNHLFPSKHSIWMTIGYKIFWIFKVNILLIIASEGDLNH